MSINQKAFICINSRPAKIKKKIMSDYEKKFKSVFYKIQSIVFRRTKINFQGLFTIRLDNVGCRRIQNSKVWISLSSRLEALINEYDESVFIKKKRNVVNKITGHQQFAILSCSRHRKKSDFTRDMVCAAECRTKTA